MSTESKILLTKPNLEIPGQFTQVGISKKGNVFYKTFIKYEGHRTVPDGIRQTKTLHVFTNHNDCFRVLSRIPRRNRTPMWIDNTYDFYVGDAPDLEARAVLLTTLNTKFNIEAQSLAEVVAKKAFPWVTPILQGGEELPHAYLFKLPNAAMRATDINDFSNRLVGKRHLRKDFKKALISSISYTNLNKLYWANYFSSGVGTEVLRDFLNNTDASHQYLRRPPIRSNVRTPKVLMSKFNQTQLKRMLGDRTSFDNFWMLNQLLDIDPSFNVHDIGTNNPENIHDFLVTTLNRHRGRRAAPSTPRKLKPPKRSSLIQSKIHEHVSENLRYHVAQDEQTLFDWGRYMSNCIGSYTHSPSSLIGVFEGKKLIANIELQDKTKKDPQEAADIHMKQCLGRFNNSLPDAVREQIISDLTRQFGSLKTEGAWI